MPNSSRAKRNQAPKISRRDAITALAFIAALVGAAILLAPLAPGGAKDTGKLYGDLPFDAAQADIAFQTRVVAAFPLLTAQDALVRRLSSEGFKATSPGRMAYRRWVVRRSPTCGFDASVAWEADDQGRITALQAHYLRALGCLERGG